MQITEDFKSQVTSPKEWRQKQFRPVKLPSGIVAILKPVSTELVLRNGNVPDTLTPLVEEFFTGKGKEPTTLEDLRKNIDFINLVCELSFVYPKFTQNPKEDDFGYDDLDEEDKFFVFSLINKPSSVLERFREKQEGALDTVQLDESNSD